MKCMHLTALCSVCFDNANKFCFEMHASVLCEVCVLVMQTRFRYDMHASVL